MDAGSIMPKHHPDKKRFPDWTLELGNHYYHKAVTIAQRTKPTIEKLARAFIDALEYEYLMTRKELDCAVQPQEGARHASAD
jgi:hypothetical protein